MRQSKRMTIWLRLFCGLLLVPQMATGDRPISDDEKKAAVYRMYEDYKGEGFPGVRDISPHKAMALLLSGDVLFVDTRKPEEMDVSTLPGAISREAFLADVGRHEGKTIVAYCTISYRSGLFVKEMADRGVTAYNLKGGILAWTLEGGKIFDADGETKRIHVYGKKWDYAPDGYEAITFGFLKQLF